MRRFFLYLVGGFWLVVALYEDNTKDNTPSDSPIDTRIPISYDYVNGRPIYPEDTLFLRKNPLKPGQWIPKTTKLPKTSTPNLPYDTLSRKIEDLVEVKVEEAITY